MPEYFTDEVTERVRLHWERNGRVREEYGALFTEIARILYEHDFLGITTEDDCPEDEYRDC